MLEPPRFPAPLNLSQNRVSLPLLPPTEISKFFPSFFVVPPLITFPSHPLRNRKLSLLQTENLLPLILFSHFCILSIVETGALSHFALVVEKHSMHKLSAFLLFFGNKKRIARERKAVTL